MNRTVAALSIAAAFAAGCGVTHFLRPALAAENITAQVIHVPELVGDALGPASATGFRSKMFVSADGATISVQDGNVPRHMHPNTNEIQYILEGTGTVWLGDKEVQVKPVQTHHDQDGATGARRHQDAAVTLASSLRQ